MVCRGLSETVAIVVLIGLAISFSIAFLVYVQSDYGVRQDLAVLQRAIESERMGSIVRLVHATGESAAFLFRRLDGGGSVMFFLDNGAEYIDCMDVVEDVSSGAVVPVDEYSVDSVTVVSRDGVYSFRHYARARGLPDSGRVKICAVEVSQNSVVTLALMKPVVRGYNYTVLESYSRRWRLYGSLRFRVAGVHTNPYLYINGTEYPLRVGQSIRIDVDSGEGVVKLNRVKQIEELNILARAVYIDGALLAKNVYVYITGGVTIDAIGSSLSIEVLPDPPGYTRLVYQGQPQLTIEEDSNDSYIRVVGWGVDSVRGLAIQMSQGTLYSEGVAHTIYIVQRRSSDESFLATLRLYTVTIVSGKPYLVDVHEYRLSSN